MLPLLLLFLNSCGLKSETDVIKNAKEAAEEVFKTEKVIVPNHELIHVSLYLPDRMKVEEEDTNNIILKDNNQIFIVFYNKLEKPTSQLNYQSLQDEDALLLESFQDPEQFGYIDIKPEEEGEYEMQIGVGGVKITTNTTKSKMSADAEELMRIALSVLIGIAEENN